MVGICFGRQEKNRWDMSLERWGKGGEGGLSFYPIALSHTAVAAPPFFRGKKTQRDYGTRFLVAEEDLIGKKRKNM